MAAQQRLVTSAVQEVVVDTRISAKTNKPYSMLQVVCSGDYTLELFLTAEQAYILNGLAEKAEAKK